MGLSQKLVLKQGQSLVMTPQLQQAIKLLQMSSVELQAFVDAELERNPLLEREEGAGEAVEARAEQTAPASLDEAFTGQSAAPEDMGGDAEAPEGASARMADEASMPRDSGWASLRSSGHLSFDGEDGDFAANLSSGISLAEHLTSQLNLEFTEPADLMIGQHLIGMLNEAGYLSGDPASLGEILKATPEQIETVLVRLRRFEPAGVFARDLAECLKLQLIDQDRLDPAMAALVDNLPLVARRDFNALKAKCGVTMDDLQDMLAELRSRSATDKRWIEEFVRAEQGAMSDARMQAAMQELVKSGNSIAAAELLADWPTPDDNLTAKAIKQLAPQGLAAMQRLADERQPVALRWLAKIYLRGDADLKVEEDSTRGGRLLDAAVRLNEPGALWLQTGYSSNREERIRLLTALSKTGKNRYACLAMAGAHWQDPGETKVLSLAFSGPERRIKSFLAYRTGASYSAVGYPIGRTAVEWTTRAFEMGCELASAFSVGHAYDPFTETEPGVAKDARRALDWYLRSSKQGEEVGGWVPYRLFVLHALGQPPVAADAQKARLFLDRIFQVEEPEPWGLMDDLLQNPRLSSSHLREFAERYVRWMLPATKSPADVAFVANEARRLAEAKTHQSRTAARTLCSIAAELKNEPCRKWLIDN